MPLVLSYLAVGLLFAMPAGAVDIHLQTDRVEVSEGVISKTAETPGASRSGDLVGWTIGLSGPSTDFVGEVVDEPGPGHAYAPGSAVAPPGWTINEGTPPTGVTFTLTDPAATVLQASSTIQPPAGSQSIAGSGNGDGYAPVYWSNRIYTINHHEIEFAVDNSGNVGPAQARPFQCFDLAKSAPCAGFPRPLPDGDPKTSGETIRTAWNQEGILVDGDRLYYPVTIFEPDPGDGTTSLPDHWGLGCFDLAVESECGYLRFGTNQDQLKHDSFGAIEGPWSVGGSLYLVDQLGWLHCATVSSTWKPSTCGSTALNLWAFDVIDGGPIVWNSSASPKGYNLRWGSGIFADVHDLRLYLSSTESMLCIDLTGTPAPCSGWSGAVGNPVTHGTAYTSASVWRGQYLTYDTAGSPKLLCRKAFCVDVANGVSAAPAVLPIPDLLADAPSPITEAEGRDIFVDGRSYYPEFVGTRITCVDWTTSPNASLCAGFGTNGVVSAPPHPVSTSVTQIYGIGLQDDRCAWVYGDESHLWSFDLATGGRCGEDGTVSTEESLDPTAWVCRSGSAGATWGMFNVQPFDPASWTALSVDLIDETNTTIQSTDLLTAALPLDLSSLSAERLTYRLTGTVAAGAASSPVSATMTARLINGPEFCLQTEITAGGSCDGSVAAVNTATARPTGDAADIERGVADDGWRAIESVLVHPPARVDGCVPPFDCELEAAADPFGDLDGDLVPNADDEDPCQFYTGTCGDPHVDSDGDAIPDNIDPDDDNDNIPDLVDDQPCEKVSCGFVEQVADIDGDGIANIKDPDVDGDDVPNRIDPDVDGDGVLNDNDDDIDGDGIPNECDMDCDGDGIPNDRDDDIDGDGIPNALDSDSTGDPVRRTNWSFVLGGAAFSLSGAANALRLRRS